MIESCRTHAACVRFFYCGRGDTILVEAGRHWGLIDCNLTQCSQAYFRVRDLIRREMIEELQFVCLTHPDRDHYHGMSELLAECFWDADLQLPRFRKFWDSGVPFELLEAVATRMDTKGAARELKALYDFICPLIQRKKIERFGLNELDIASEVFGEFFFISLAPRRNRVDQFTSYRAQTLLQSAADALRKPREESNNLSVVLVLMHQALPLNILFGGDATAEVWQEAIDAWKRLHRMQCFQDRCRDFTGVKVSHHGARGSLYEDLYGKYCRPETTIAILSVGCHDPDHPHPEVLRVLKSNGIRTYATCWPTSESAELSGTLPIPGSPVGTPANRFPLLSGYCCADVEVRVSLDGSVEVTPAESLL